jgi:uncharacterized membrane protein
MVQFREWIALAAQGVETLAVVLMVAFIIFGTVRWVFHSANRIEGAYERYRVVLGKTLLIGLELLVAADIIRTVALDMTPTNLALLGGIVVVRTFLGWSVTVEIEGHWPWQKAKEDGPETPERPGNNKQKKGVS